MADRAPSWLQWFGALGAPTLATLACLGLDPLMSVAGLAMVYLLASIAAALLLDRAPAITASVLCVTGLNYFFVPPRHSFEVDGAEYWWTLAVLLGLSLAAGQMVARLREGRERAQAGEARAAQLHALGEALATATSHEGMADTAARWLAAALQRDCAVFVRGDADALQCFGSAGDAAFHPASAQWAVEHGRLLGRGCDDWPDLPLWCAPFARRGATGAVQVLLPAHERVPAAQLRHWEELARQAGLAIERERAAAAARRAQLQARSEEARNTLLASLSHDLRTPLAGIVGSASALRTQDASLTAAQRTRLLANLENEARDLALMADNVLQLARLSQPQAQLRTQWESLEEVLGAAVARMRRRWEGARIQLRVAAGLPPLQVEAALLAQVLANLVDNALRHSPAAAPVTITAGRSRDGVFIAVRDEGSGLPEGDAATLFDRFRGGSGAAAAGGAGLGLAICRLAVQAHHGRIEARRCEPGTEVRIDLPVAAAPERLDG